MTLSNLSAVVDQLGEDAAKLSILFVTVGPRARYARGDDGIRRRLHAVR